MDPMPPVVPQAAWSQGRSTSGEEMEQAAGAEPRNRWAGSLQSLPRWCRPEYESAIHIPSRPRTAPCQFPPALGASLGDIEYQRLWDSRIVCMYNHRSPSPSSSCGWLGSIWITTVTIGQQCEHIHRSFCHRLLSLWWMAESRQQRGKNGSIESTAIDCPQPSPLVHLIGMRNRYRYRYRYRTHRHRQDSGSGCLVALQTPSSSVAVNHRCLHLQLLAGHRVLHRWSVGPARP